MNKYLFLGDAYSNIFIDGEHDQKSLETTSLGDMSSNDMEIFS